MLGVARKSAESLSSSALFNAGQQMQLLFDCNMLYLELQHLRVKCPSLGLWC